MADRLAELLLKDGAVSEETVQRALDRQQEAGGALDTALLEVGGVEATALEGYLVRASGLPLAPPSAWGEPDTRARRVFPAKVAERHGIVPFALEGRELSVVSAYPPDLGLLDEISFMLSLHLRPHVAPEFRVRELVQRIYGTPMPQRLAALAGAPPEAPPPDAGDLPPGGKADAGAPQPAEAGSEPYPAPGLPLEGSGAERDPRPGGRPPGDVAGRDVPGRRAEEEAEAVVGAMVEALDEDLPDPDVEPVEEEAPPASPLAVPPQPGGSSPGTTRPAPAPRPPPSTGDGRLPRMTPAPRHAPALAGPAPPGQGPPGWTLGEARAALASARDRDEVIGASLRYARDFFEYAAMFAVTRDALYGHEALGREEGVREECRRVAAELSDPGFFRIAVETRGPYLGPPPLDPVTASILSGLRRGTPRTVLLHPVFVRERTVAVLYADNGEAPVSARRLGDLFLVLGSLGAAFERVIRERKLHPPSGLDEETWQVTEPARTADEAMPIAVDVDLGDYEVATASEALSSPRALDLATAVDRLATSARGSAERSSLLSTLAQRGPEAALLLASRLPGPVEVAAEMVDATPVHEHGPILAALAALGPAALKPLLALLGDPDADRRRYAVLLLGALGDPAVLPGLAVRVFDDDPRVAAAAREALAAARRHADLGSVAEGLRRELATAGPGRVILAARALARLGDAEAVPVLIQVLEQGGEVAVAVADALTRITLQRLGNDRGRWLAWWKERRGTPRARWLLEALTSQDREVRQAAAEELRQAGTPPVPYFADAPAPERERAARAWSDWWQRSGITL